MKIYVLLMLISVIVGFAHAAGRGAKRPAPMPSDSLAV
jgi:hypothetical protein